MHCGLKKMIYIKTKFFLHLPHHLLKSLFELNVKLKILALLLPLKDNAILYILNQNQIGKHPMQFHSNRLISIKALS